MDSLKCALYFYAIGELIVNDHQPFELVTNYEPAGDQPQAIAKLVDGVNKGFHDQLLLGVTGSGKTYTMANVISQLQKD